MAGPTDELIQRMLAAVAEVPAERIDRLVAEARAQAEAEVKALLKKAIKAALLHQTVARLESLESPETSPQTSQSRGGDASGDIPPPQMSVSDQAPEPAPGQPERTSPVSPPTDLPEFGCYVYGITRAGTDLPPAEVGGVADAPPRLVGYGDLQAITARVPLAEFGQAGLGKRAKDLEWVERNARAHDAVLRSAMAAGPVIPLRFCTVLRSEDDLRRVLEQHHDGLSATLSDLAGKTEWGVKGYAHAETLSRYLQRSSGRLRAAAAGMADDGQGKAYLLEKQRKQLVRSEAGRALRAAVQACHQQLADLACGAVALPLKGRAANGHDGEVALNGAYLVADDQAARFHERVAALTAEYGPQGLTLEVTGPWPAYNFVSLDLSVSAPEPAR